MAHPMTLPLLGVLSLVGAGAGLYLGKAAVGEINPAYFSTPESGSRWHADLTPSRAPFAAVPLSSPDGTTVASSNCVGCIDYPEEYIPIHDASVDRYETGYARTSSEPTVQLAVYQEEEPQPEAEAQRLAELERVQRYASNRWMAEAQAASEATEATSEPSDQREVELAAAD